MIKYLKQNVNWNLKYINKYNLILRHALLNIYVKKINKFLNQLYLLNKYNLERVALNKLYLFNKFYFHIKQPSLISYKKPNTNNTRKINIEIKPIKVKCQKIKTHGNKNISSKSKIKNNKPTI